MCFTGLALISGEGEQDEEEDWEEEEEEVEETSVKADKEKGKETEEFHCDVSMAVSAPARVKAGYCFLYRETAHEKTRLKTQVAILHNAHIEVKFLFYLLLS